MPPLRHVSLAEGLACAVPVARTPIGVSGNFYVFFTNFKFSQSSLVLERAPNTYKICNIALFWLHSNECSLVNIVTLSSNPESADCCVHCALYYRPNGTADYDAVVLCSQETTFIAWSIGRSVFSRFRFFCNINKHSSYKFMS